MQKVLKRNQQEIRNQISFRFLICCRIYINYLDRKMMPSMSNYKIEFLQALLSKILKKMY